MDIMLCKIKSSCAPRYARCLPLWSRAATARATPASSATTSSSASTSSASDAGADTARIESVRASAAAALTPQTGLAIACVGATSYTQAAACVTHEYVPLQAGLYFESYPTVVAHWSYTDPNYGYRLASSITPADGRYRVSDRGSAVPDFHRHRSMRHHVAFHGGCIESRYRCRLERQQFLVQAAARLAAWRPRPARRAAAPQSVRQQVQQRQLVEQRLLRACSSSSGGSSSSSAASSSSGSSSSSSSSGGTGPAARLAAKLGAPSRLLLGEEEEATSNDHCRLGKSWPAAP
jgi:hypothetical protein